jgi:hypothetical protein
MLAHRVPTVLVPEHLTVTVMVLVVERLVTQNSAV